MTETITMTRLNGPRTFLGRAGVGAAGHIIQRSDTTSRQVLTDQATLILVEDGKKRIRWSGGEVVAAPGDAIAVQAGETVDISNTPGKSGVYRALWICWSAELLPALTGRRSAGVALQRALGDEFRGAYYRAFDSLDADAGLPASVATSRVQEVLLWLGDRGFRFSPPPPASLGVRVRRIIATDPSVEWSMEHVAHETATSVPTLRRKLAAEGIAFRDLVQDVRMSHALALLQNTDQPVLNIALAAGYGSASRFTARFRARFGYVPTDIRGQSRGRR